MGATSAMFYKYKSKYGGMEPSDVKRLRVLEDESGKRRDINSKNEDVGWRAESCGAFDGSSSGQPATSVRCAAN
jgi:putative transposase